MQPIAASPPPPPSGDVESTTQLPLSQWKPLAQGTLQVAGSGELQPAATKSKARRERM
jgi:hypothetical protein